MLKTRFPGAYAYFQRFEKELHARSGYKRYFQHGKDPFWSLYNVGSYTLAPYKVVWREQARAVTCAVVSTAPLNGGEAKVVVPDHKVLFIPVECREEAAFLASLLNSRVAQLMAKAYTLETSISTHLAQHIFLPELDGNQRLHRELAALAQALQVDPAAAGHLQGELDRLAAELWGLNGRELSAVVREIDSLLPS